MLNQVIRSAFNQACSFGIGYAATVPFYDFRVMNNKVSDHANGFIIIGASLVSVSLINQLSAQNKTIVASTVFLGCMLEDGISYGCGPECSVKFGNYVLKATALSITGMLYGALCDVGIYLIKAYATKVLFPGNVGVNVPNVLEDAA